jgi:hypothetical protein
VCEVSEVRLGWCVVMRCVACIYPSVGKGYVCLLIIQISRKPYSYHHNKKKCRAMIVLLSYSSS